MKQESGKKSKKWIWLVVGLAVLLAAVGIVLALVLGGGQQGTGPAADGRPELYWNIDREVYTQNSDAGLSNREPDANGAYYIRFAFNGEMLELQVADKQLVNYIDAMDAMGLVFDNDGVVVDAVPASEIATEIGLSIYVQQVTEDVLIANSSIAMNGMRYEIPMTELLEIYDVTIDSKTPGAKLSLADMQIMDSICLYGNLQQENTHIFVQEHQRESKVYWRAEQFYSSATKASTRVRGEDGFYTLDFFCDGERVTLKTASKDIVDKIDTTSKYSPHFGFIFDEEGYIIEVINSGVGIHGMIRSERYDVTSIDGNTINTTKLIGSNMGATDSFVLGEDCIIYDASTSAKSEGRQGKPVDGLQVGDRIVVWTDTQGNPLMVYIAVRVVDSPLYISSKRMYDGTNKVTKRVPDAEGYYVFEVFGDGKLMTVRTKDKDLATQMDKESARVFGLKLNGDIVEAVYDVESVFGYAAFGTGRYVTDVTGSIFTCFKTTAPDVDINGVMSSDCVIYNVSKVGQYGEITKLQEGDYIYAYRSPAGEVVMIYVIRRMVDADLYYSLSRMYDSKNLVTKREPDADGWYVFDVAVNGKRTTVKTRSKAMATKMDAFSPAAMALQVNSSGVVIDAFDPTCVHGGYKRASGYTVTGFNEDGTVNCVYKPTGGTYTLKLAQGYKVYNVSMVTHSDRGEATSLRVGDVITAFTDFFDAAATIFVRTREVDNLYFNTERMYDTEKAESTRQPDANGWYVYRLAVNGKVQTFKTKDKKIADQVDYYGGAFGVYAVDGVIRCVVSPAYAKNVTGTDLINYDVMKISGNQITYRYNGSGSKDGDTVQRTNASNVKIYDVSPTAKVMGAATKLQVGDRVRVYKGDDGNTSYIYIYYRCTRPEGGESLCPVCNEVVYWTPWIGGSFASAGGHYYLNTDIETTATCSTGRKTLPVSQVCLDLNGKTYYRTDSRAMYVYQNATLNVFDRVGGGTVTANGSSDSGVNGGVISVNGGTLNLYSGTFKLADTHAEIPSGGVLWLGKGGTVNMYGGAIANGSVTGRGGNVYVTGAATFNLHGGTISGGEAAEHGGNICMVSNSSVNIFGGTVTGGAAVSNGGNMYLGTGVFTMTGGTVTGGTAKSGGNAYCLETVNILGGTVSNGTATGSGGNLFASAYNEKSVLNLGAATISGSSSDAKGGNIYTEIGGTFNGTKISGGQAKDGGNIYFVGGTAVMENVTISGGTTAARGGNVYVSGTALDIIGGTITGGTSGTENANGGGNICAVSNATLSLDGTSVTNGVSQNTAGNILAGSGTLKLNNVTVTGGTAPQAGKDVYIYGGATDATVTGGNFDQLNVDAAKQLTLSGAPKIKDLILGSGVKANVDALEQGTQITLTADGIFTQTLTDAESYLNYFVSGVDGSLIYVDSDALAMASGIKQAPCAHCGETVIWKQWKGTASGGHYYLAEDYVNETASGVSIAEGAEVVLDLAGKNFTGESTRAFDVKGSLAILDSEGNGEIVTGGMDASDSVGGVIRVRSGSFDLYGGTLRLADAHNAIVRGGVIYIDDAGTVNIHGGTIANGVTSDRGGNIYLEGGGAVLNVLGGTITGGTSGSGNANGGGNIAVLTDSTVNISGGTISDGNSVNTAGNILATGNLHISGGTISGGTATKSAQNIYVFNNSGDVTVSGGTIESITVNGPKSFVLSGKPVISNMEITAGKTITLGELVDRAQITVTAEGTFTAASDKAEEYAKYFASAVADTQITVVDGALAVTSVSAPTEPTVPDTTEPEITQRTAYCAHCDKTVTWTAWDGTASSGHYYLAEDYVNETASGVSIAEGAEVVLDLAGKNFTGESTRAFDVKGSLAIVDSEGNGEIVTGGMDASDSLGGVIRVRSGSFDLYGGTLRLADTHSEILRGGVIYIDDAGTVNIHGGTIANGVTSDRGGNIYLEGGGAVLNVMGGTITGGTSGSNNANGGGNIAVLSGSTVNISGGTVSNGNSVNTAGNILATGNLHISGGTVSGGTATKSAPSIYVFNNSGDVTVSGGNLESITVNGPKSFVLSGKPAIANMEITAGKTITLGELVEGAQITVTAEGIFTAASDKAEEYAKHFASAVADTKIEVVDGALAVTSVSAPTEPTTPETTDPSVPETTEPTVPETTEPEETEPEICPCCQKAFADITWTVWDGTVASGHYYLDKPVEMDAEVVVAEGVNIVLDLRDQTWSSTGRAFIVNGTLTILDTGDNGTVKAAGVNKSAAGVISVLNGTLNLCGGTLEQIEAEGVSVTDGGVVRVGDGTFTMYSGTIKNGVAGRGGNIYLTGKTVFTMYGGSVLDGEASNTANAAGNIRGTADTTINLYGGTVSGGTATKGAAGNIYAGGVLNITGGTVSGGSAVKDGPDIYAMGTVSVSGAPKIGISLGAGKVITLGELTEGAEILVIADGVCTEASDKAGAYLAAGYIKPGDTSVTLTEADGIITATVAAE